MFDQLFARQAAVARHRSAPYAAERERYLRHLAMRHYSLTSRRRAAHDLLAIVLQTDLPCRRHVTVSAIREATRQRRSLHQGSRQRSSEHIRASLRRTATAWMAFLGKFVADPEQVTRDSVVLKHFETFLRDERGLALSTVKRCCRHARRLLDQLTKAGRTLRRVRLDDIDSYISALTASGWRRSSLPGAADAVRSLLRFAQSRGLCTPGLADGVAAPRIYADERLPEGLEWATVTRLIVSSRGDSACDVRDHALFLLLSVYGLRCSEIAELRLDDINWDNGTISVRRPKQRHTQQYPLEATTGQAILRYIREARTQTECRHVFLNLFAPTRPITHISIYHAIHKRLRALGLQGPRRGPHALRHACARRLLANGFTFKQVGDHLGHRSSAATRIYAKVDLNSLREVAEIDLRGIL
ncbi:MAG: tyrosine-type recombinase/integrase [Steroidobacteraceae bacterium]